MTDNVLGLSHERDHSDCWPGWLRSESARLRFVR